MFVVSVILLEFVNSNVPGYVNDYADELRHRNFYLSLKTSSDWDTNLKENGWRSSCTPTDMIRAGVKEVVISDHPCRHFDSCTCPSRHYVWPHQGESLYPLLCSRSPPLTCHPPWIFVQGRCVTRNVVDSILSTEFLYKTPCPIVVACDPGRTLPMCILVPT